MKSHDVPCTNGRKHSSVCAQLLRLWDPRTDVGLPCKTSFRKRAMEGLHGESPLQKKVGSELENEFGLEDRDDRYSAEELGPSAV